MKVMLIQVLFQDFLTVKNKAIDVGSKAFSMVSEVANKSFESKNENL